MIEVVAWIGWLLFCVLAALLPPLMDLIFRTRKA